jgi:hypothetical protein
MTKHTLRVVHKLKGNFTFNDVFFNKCFLIQNDFFPPFPCLNQ